MIPTFTQWGDMMTVTSELERFCRRPTHLGWDEGAFKAALQHDWDHGRDEQLYAVDLDGKNGVIQTDDGFIGLVGIFDQQSKRPLVGFRSIPKNGNPTWRSVFGKAVDGRIVHAGKLRRETQWAKDHGYR